MNEKENDLRQDAFDKFLEKESAELLEIWDKYDKDKFSDVEFEVIGNLLKSRNINLNAPRDYSKTETHIDSTKNYQKTEGGFWSFDKMVSSSLIKSLYILGALGITIFSFVMFSNASEAKSGGAWLVLLGLIYLIIGNLLWRIVCEGTIIIFKIFDKLNQIESKIN